MTIIHLQMEYKFIIFVYTYHCSKLFKSKEGSRKLKRKKIKQTLFGWWEKQRNLGVLKASFYSLNKQVCLNNE